MEIGGTDVGKSGKELPHPVSDRVVIINKNIWKNSGKMCFFMIKFIFLVKLHKSLHNLFDNNAKFEKN